MTEPDELYTLRAQFWLGHYQQAAEEAKSIARRPMSPALKAEREEFLARAQVALGQEVTGGTPALDAIALKAQFEAAAGNEAAAEAIVDQLKSLLGQNPTPAVQLIASQVFLAAGQTKDALAAVSVASTNLEHMATVLQIYLKLDRLDLAQSQLTAMKQADEEAILTQLAGVYCNLATGSTGASDALHTLHALSEQYGPSAFLLNLTACASMQAGDYAAASERLQECVRDFAESSMPDTYVNMMVCASQQGLSPAEPLAALKESYPHHAVVASLDRFTAGLDREAIKYKV